MPESAERHETPARLTLGVPDMVGRFPLAATLGGVALAAVTYALATTPGEIGFHFGAWVTVLGGAYAVLQAAVNQRLFLVDDAGLHVVIGPLPWFRDELHLADVAELFVERNWTEDVRSSYRFIFELFARTRSGQRVALFENASDPVLVHWLAQELAVRLEVPWNAAPEPWERG